MTQALLLCISRAVVLLFNIDHFGIQVYVCNIYIYIYIYIYI